VWFIAIVVLALIGVAVFEQTDKPVATPYSTFLDQVEAGKIASVTIEGTEIHGRFKQPLDGTQRDTFHTRVPDFGDPTLVAELRKQRVTINVAAPSAWNWLLGRVPWPMLIFVGAIFVAGVVRLVRGGKARSVSAVPTLPAHGIVGLVSGLFAKQRPGENPPTRDSDEPKNR
jgi:cell division protease FtsH